MKLKRCGVRDAGFIHNFQGYSLLLTNDVEYHVRIEWDNAGGP